MIYSIQGRYHRIKSEDGLFYDGTLNRSLPDQSESIVAIGDWIEFREHSGREAIIDQIYPRRNRLARLVTSGRKSTTQVIAANLDQLVIVASAADPVFKPGLVDRYLLLALRESIPVILIINKTDLNPDISADDPRIRYYAETIPVIFCSAHSGWNLEAVRSIFGNRTSVLTGHSGVGKSSILNALIPYAELKVKPLRGKSGKGAHTTTASIGFELDNGGILFDTPGIRKLSLGPMAPRQIQWYFPDFADYALQCRFADCLHLDEPQCAVKQALQEKKISMFRYRSYCRLVGESDASGRLEKIIRFDRE